MDDLKAKLQAALKEAMAAKNAARRDTLRLLMSALKQVEIDERKELTNDDVAGILQKEAKKRRESIDEMGKAGRAALAETEQRELNLIEEFLPKQMARAEVAALAREAIAQSGATSAKEMGKVMAVLMPKVKGLADGKLVNDVVRELLSS